MCHFMSKCWSIFFIQFFDKDSEDIITNDIEILAVLRVGGGSECSQTFKDIYEGHDHCKTMDNFFVKQQTCN